jgi:NAD(P)H-dependent FMN reductase
MTPYFLALCDLVTKYSKTAFLLRAIDGLLQERGFQLRTAQPGDPTNTSRDQLQSVESGVEDLPELTRNCQGILLITSACKGASFSPINTLLEHQPDNAWNSKTVAMIVIGGFPGQAVQMESQIRPILRRLSARKMLPSVHLSAGNWILVSDDRPRLARGSERAVGDTLNLLLEDPAFRNVRAVA